MSAFSDLQAACQEQVDLVGVPIIYRGITKKCITGAIERKRKQEVVAMLGEAATKVDMMAADFDAFIGIKANSSNVTIDSIVFTVMTIERDPADPMVHFLVVADH